MKYSDTRSKNASSLQLESMAIEMPAVEGHPNRAAFQGVLTFVGIPSDKAPAGAQGHRVLLTRAATERALPSLLGMAVDYAPTLDRHDARRKVGIITRAEVLPGEDEAPRNAAKSALSSAASRQAVVREARAPGHKLRAGASAVRTAASTIGTQNTSAPRIDVAGYIFARDFPELMREMRSGGPSRLGMSYEIADARIDDLRAPIWTITEFLFTGAAVLRRDKAAYQNTWIELT